jgi:hypothetical protein
MASTIRLAVRAALLLGSACSTVACSGGDGAKGSADSGAEAGAATFGAIYNDILQGSCALSFCHLGSLTPMPLPDQATAYMQLVNVPASGANCSGMGIRVVPGHPETSLLYDKIASRTPTCGAPMPGSGKPALLASDIARIKEWITMGAKND